LREVSTSVWWFAVFSLWSPATLPDSCRHDLSTICRPDRVGTRSL